MTKQLEDYWRLLAELRATRQQPSWTPLMDRELLKQIDEVFESLDEGEQELARAGTFRGWPEDTTKETA